LLAKETRKLLSRWWANQRRRRPGPIGKMELAYKGRPRFSRKLPQAAKAATSPLRAALYIALPTELMAPPGICFDRRPNLAGCATLPSQHKLRTSHWFERRLSPNPTRPAIWAGGLPVSAGAGAAGGGWFGAGGEPVAWVLGAGAGVFLQSITAIEAATAIAIKSSKNGHGKFSYNRSISY